MALAVCLIGHFPKIIDEGCRKVAKCYQEILSVNNRVLSVDIHCIYRQLLLIHNFKPDIIHFVLGPSNISVMPIIRMIQILFGGKAKMVMSAIQPNYDMFKSSWPLEYFLKDVVVLAQSELSESLFNRFARKVYFVPNGIHSQVGKGANRVLGEIQSHKKVILHVGACTSGRNVEKLIRLQDDRWQVVVIGRESSGDVKIEESLRRAGCIVFNRYIPNIADVYERADCYIFPTVDPKYCIDTPLSVLEAMSHNVPIASTPFGALPRMFLNNNDFRYILSFDNGSLLEIVNNLLDENLIVTNKEKVERYTWDAIAEEIENIYEEV